ncbi:hypothetical protein FWP46_13305 [Vibrio alginolyticus]|nr:hypothetical protein [Vibrio alginolyticus]EGQ9763435.1 hypothetical protein [Vibrio alginolyticus]EGR0804358.1 hypothetical protein [Vibrio alginolyticus]EGR1563093.1 hypothetical protein [Vibrio alginolyticus]EHA1097801.1 hypothetical protein [Vibrio alginolyticus]
MSTNSTTRATQSCDGLDTICLCGLCRENEAYFNGLIYLVNKKLVSFIQMVKKPTQTNKGRSFCSQEHQHALLSFTLLHHFMSMRNRQVTQIGSMGINLTRTAGDK